jgi:endo-1,4-beta-mannosidase
MQSDRFLVGVNYWPASQFINMWKDFNATAIEEDFAKAKEYGIELLRFFITWEDFQPHPNLVDQAQLKNLDTLLSVAVNLDLKVIPTLLVGHMSATNWLPAWLQSDESGQNTWPVYYDQRLSSKLPFSIYSHPIALKAQELLIKTVVAAMKHHTSIWSWDFSNEMDNIQKPTDQQAYSWQQKMINSIKNIDPDRPIIHGTHIPQIDGYGFPLEALALGDYVSLHTYPMYNDKAATDLTYVNKNISYVQSAGKPVLVEEFGVPTIPQDKNEITHMPARHRLVSEEDQADYILGVIHQAREMGCLGAVAWCWTDYDQSLFEKYPFNTEIHERYFGLFRSDGSPKLVARQIQDYVRSSRA